MIHIDPPSYDSHGLSNLAAELEFRLTGTAVSPRLNPGLGSRIPDADTYVLALFDGLGTHQLGHRLATDLADAVVGTMDAPFPSTTTVSLATVSTGLPPSQHGLIAYKMWMPEHQTVVNTIHMTTRSGEPVDVGVDALLPAPNLWERLASSGLEPIVVQPGNFHQTSLTRTLYRGARFEGYWDLDEAVEVVVDVARTAGRLVFVYVPHVDFAAHTSGQESEEYAEALRNVNRFWVSLSARLSQDAALIGTADHGHVDIPEIAKSTVHNSDLTEPFISEDGRVLFVHGSGAALATEYGGISIDASEQPWWGPKPHHPAFAERRPTDIVFLPPGTAVFDDRSNTRLVGYHGSLESVEREIPLLARIQE